LLSKKTISIVQYIFFLLVGLGLLYLVFRKLDMHEVLNEIKNVRYEWLLLSLCFGLVSHIARAFRWNILIRSMGYKTNTMTTFYAVMTGYLANAAFPRLGEVTKCAVLSKKKNIPFNELFGTVISERLFDLFTLIVIILLVIFLQLDFLKSFVDKYIITYFSRMMEPQSMIFGIVLTVLIIALPIVLYKIFVNRIKEFAIYKKAHTFIKGLLDGIKTIKRMKHKGIFILWTLVLWSLYALMTYVAFFALGATSHLSFGDGITIMALGSLGIVAPVPGGIGAYQFIVKAILVEIYFIASEPAASFSIVMWSTQTILIIGAGLISYYMIVEKNSKKNEQDAS